MTPAALLPLLAAAATAPADLLGPASPLGSPAPYPLLVFFKVLGFTLHMLPMNLWYAGIWAALLARLLGGAEARRWATRLMRQMPLFIALGINFGIVPLLFTQVTNYRVFYPATILMAWPWLSIIGMLTLAYYGVYVYGAGLKSGRMTPLNTAAGWLSAVLFLAMGFVFTNAMTLQTNLPGWAALWRAHGAAGAATGTALNTADPTLWPRWLMVIGLALTTTAAHVVVDAAVFGAREGEAYRKWAPGFALRLHAFGFAWFGGCAAWYALGTWRPEIRQLMLSGGLLPLSLAAGLAPGLVALLLVAGRRRLTPGYGWALAAAQFLVLGVNAIARQVVQNAELRPWLDVTAEPVRTQWSPLVGFLLLFVAGAVLIGWMVAQVVRVERGTTDRAAA